MFCLVVLLIPSPGQAQERRTKIGTAGGNGGDEFEDTQLPVGARVIGVKIRLGDRIDAVQLLYKDAKGKTESLSRHGGAGGQEYTFLLEEGEYITGIHGRTGEYLESLTIVTSKRKSKTYGGNGGFKAYKFETTEGEVVGFYGRAGLYVDQIGIIVKKKQ